MARVIFGVAASHFAAVQALQQTATDFGKKYPLASTHVLTSFYVNDSLVGADTPQEAAQLQQQLRALLLKGGFDLHRWRSSSTTVMDSIPKDLHSHLSQVKLLMDEDTNQPQKALSMFWDAHKDLLYISIGNITTTNRTLVSDIANVLGWLSPSMIHIKILIQQLLELKIDWDEEVPQALQDKQQLSYLYSRNFPSVTVITILEALVYTLNCTASDASDDPYTAVVYLLTVHTTGTPTMSLVAAKTKIATLNIPRLELLEPIFWLN